MAATQKSRPGHRQRHVPQRTCIACRRTDAKRGLLRLVRSAEGRVELDPTGKRNGRGAYLCHDPNCWEQALRRKGLERALRLEALHLDDRTTLEQFAAGLEAADAAPAVITTSDDHGSS